jgi:hypothetical protein
MQKAIDELGSKNSKKRKQSNKKQSTPPPIWKPSDFESWDAAKKACWEDLSNNPEAFYMNYCAPGRSNSLFIILLSFGYQCRPSGKERCLDS